MNRLKQRIVSTLLLLAMLLSMIPQGLISVFAADDIDTSVIGKKAKFVGTSAYDAYYMFSDNFQNQYGAWRSELPETVVIVDVQYNSVRGGLFYKVDTVDGSAHKFTESTNKYLSDYPWVKAASLEIVETGPDDGLIEGQVGLMVDGVATSTLMFEKGEKTYVFTEVGAAVGANKTYRWQLLIDEENNRWADISGYFSPYALISESLIANAKNAVGKATLRCIVSDGKNKYVSGKLSVAAYGTAYSEVTSTDKMTMPLEDGADELSIDEAFQIAIKYEYRHASPAHDLEQSNFDGSTAAHGFTITIPAGGHYRGTVTSPSVVGYLPYILLSEAGDYVTDKTNVVTYAGLEYVAAPSIYFEDVTEKIDLVVYYLPQKVNFMVKIYEQNLHDDEYTLVGTEIVATKLADEAVGEDLDADRTGFTPLYYDPEIRVNGDGTAVVEIYYDRNYYLVDFDLNDGDTNEAYGATPYFVRYNAQVMLQTPTRPGYTFDDWSLTRVYVVNEDETETTITDPVVTASYTNGAAGTLLTVRHNLLYTANEWKVATTLYSLVYWLENTDSTDSSQKENYDVWYAISMSAQTGAATIAGGDHVKTYVTTQNGATSDAVADVADLYPYLTYESALTDTTTKTVAGDGSTAINIYYSRKSYTLKFYYAMSKGDQWYVIGGSSNYFGSLASPSIAGDEILLLDQYLRDANPFSQVGEVSKPTLNAKGSARNYTTGSETSKYDSSYQHHYISFTAKYGADITNLWPCDVFNSVTNKQKNTSNPKNGWSGTTAYVSAWNGEHHVKYTQDNQGGNQTVKGNYTQLDENLLWAPAYGTSDTIAYACFWENGAEGVSWNVPKLFRYKIWLPLLAGQSASGLTTKAYNGMTYYLAESYDTCDDSNVGSQTQPALVGFTKNGSSSTTLTKGTDYDGAVYQEGYEVNYYYSRIIYTLSYNDQHGNKVTLTVPYGTSLDTDTYRDADGPVYPSSLEKGEYEFGGWYADEACQIPFEFNTTMPAKNLQLYAKWTSLFYTANIYLDPEKTISLLNTTVLFGSSLKDSEPAYNTEKMKHEEFKKLDFAGWYYMDGDEEKRFDFNTMLVKQNLDIYAKWTSKVPVSYVAKYVADINGEIVEIAPRTEGMSLAGISKAFEAKVGAELDKDYRLGFFPDRRSTSIVMSNNSEDNVVTFTYSTPDLLYHTVTHEFVSDDFLPLLGTNQLEEVFVHTFSDDEVHERGAQITIDFREGVTKAMVVSVANEYLTNAGKPHLTSEQEDEIWEIVVGLSPDHIQHDLTLITGGENNATFNWTSRESVGVYEVIHYFETLDGNYVAEYYQDFAGTYGQSYTAEALERHGFERITHTNSKESGELEKISGDGGAISGGLVLKVYYDRLEYEYTVKHYILGTTTQVSPTEAPDTKETAKFGTVVKVFDLKLDLDGYDLYNVDASVEISDKDQEVICYYEGQDVYIRYQVQGNAGGTLTEYVSDTVVGTKPKTSTATAMEGYLFSGWHYEIDGVQYEVPAEWLSDDKLTISPAAPPAEWANKTVTFYASFYLTTFTVKNTSAIADNEQAFVYRISGKSTDENTKDVNLTFAVVGTSGSVTIAMLPVGEYTITALSDWSWKYATDTATQSFTIGATGNEVTFTYTEGNHSNWVGDSAIISSQVGS